MSDTEKNKKPLAPVKPSTVKPTASTGSPAKESPKEAPKVTSKEPTIAQMQAHQRKCAAALKQKAKAGAK